MKSLVLGIISFLFGVVAAAAEDPVVAESGQVSKLYIINNSDGRTILSFADGFQFELKSQFSAPENDIIKGLSDDEKASFQRNRAKIIGDFVRLMRWRKLRKGLGAVDGDQVFQVSAEPKGAHPLLPLLNAQSGGVTAFDRVLTALAQLLDHFVIQRAPVVAKTEDLGLRYDLGLAFTNTVRVLTGWNIPTTLAVSFGWDRSKKKYVFHIFADEAKEGSEKLIKKIPFMGQLSFYTAKSFQDASIGGRPAGVTAGAFAEFGSPAVATTTAPVAIRSTWSLARLEVAEFRLGAMEVHADAFRLIANFLNDFGLHVPQFLAKFVPEGSSGRKPTTEKRLACKYIFLKPPELLGTWAMLAK